MNKVMYQNNELNIFTALQAGMLPEGANDNTKPASCTPILNSTFNIGAVNIDEDGFGGM